MPIPPAVLVFAGPNLMAAKAAAIEFLPAVTSASVAAILARLTWKRIPNWIKEDVSFRKKDSSESMDVERLSSVLEKIQAWIDECSKKLQSPVPHLYSSFLIYWQLIAQQQRQKMIQGRKEDNFTGNAPIDTVLEAGIVNDDSRDVDFVILRDMLNLATWAYYLDDAGVLQEKLETLQYELKTCVLPTRPGSVGFYIAFGDREYTDSTNNEISTQDRERTLLLGVRGTSTLEELLTDACGRSVSYRGFNTCGVESGEGISSSIRVEVVACEDDKVCCPAEFDDAVDEADVEIISGHERIWIEQDSDHHTDERDADSETIPGRPFCRRSSKLDSQIRCHEGILASAKRLFLQVRPIIEQEVVLGGRRLVIVGHSLGASAGCLLAMILRSRYPELVDSARLRVYAFGPPPVLDYDSAIGASTYVTSVVHQSDLIPRCSLANLAVFLELLRTVALEVLIPNGLVPTNPLATGALLQQLSKGDKGEPLWSEQELNDAIARANAKIEVRDPDHLYVPGKVHFLTSIGDTPPLQAQEGPSDLKSIKYSCTLTDGNAPSLRVIEMNGYRMLGDHLTSSYLEAINFLLTTR